MPKFDIQNPFVVGPAKMRGPFSEPHSAVITFVTEGAIHGYLWPTKRGLRTHDAYQWGPDGSADNEGTRFSLLPNNPRFSDKDAVEFAYDQGEAALARELVDVMKDFGYEPGENVVDWLRQQLKDLEARTILLAAVRERAGAPEGASICDHVERIKAERDAYEATCQAVAEKFGFDGWRAGDLPALRNKLLSNISLVDRLRKLLVVPEKGSLYIAVEDLRSSRDRLVQGLSKMQAAFDEINRAGG